MDMQRLQFQMEMDNAVPIGQGVEFVGESLPEVIELQLCGGIQPVGGHGGKWIVIGVASWRCAGKNQWDTTTVAPGWQHDRTRGPGTQAQCRGPDRPKETLV